MNLFWKKANYNPNYCVSHVFREFHNKVHKNLYPECWRLSYGFVGVTWWPSLPLLCQSTNRAAGNIVYNVSFERRPLKSYFNEVQSFHEPKMSCLFGVIACLHNFKSLIGRHISLALYPSQSVLNRTNILWLLSQVSSFGVSLNMAAIAPSKTFLFYLCSWAASWCDESIGLTILALELLYWGILNKASARIFPLPGR